MPRYRALNALFIAERYIEPGEEFVSDLTPGRNWEPLDADASAAKAKMLEERTPRHKAADAISERLDRKNPAPSTVPIPEDWADKPKQSRRMLAMRLGAQPTVTASEADSFITAELEHRRSQKAA